MNSKQKTLGETLALELREDAAYWASPEAEMEVGVWRALEIKTETLNQLAHVQDALWA